MGNARAAFVLLLVWDVKSLGMSTGRVTSAGGKIVCGIYHHDRIVHNEKCLTERYFVSCARTPDAANTGICRHSLNELRLSNGELCLPMSILTVHECYLC